MNVPSHPLADMLAWLAVQPIDQLSREACLEQLGQLAQVRRFMQGLHTRYTARLALVSPTPEADDTDATKGSSRGSKDAARRSRGRKNSGKAGESLGRAMDEGKVSGEHFDVFLAVKATLPPQIRQRYLAHDEQIVRWATDHDVDEFRRLLHRYTDGLRRQHGIDRLEQQQRDTSLSTWVDEYGMLRVSATLDPLSGAVFRAALDAELDRLRRGPTPPHCPDDPAARRRFLQAHALMGLIGRDPSGSDRGPRAELVIIADTTRTNHRGEPTLDWGLPVDLPLRALTQFFAGTHRTTVVDVTTAGSVRDLTDRLNLGRHTRLANRAQRRVLRVLHPTCIVPGCREPFDRCRIHHVTWWRHGGATDLANLAPLCFTHHTRVHEERWRIAIDERRRVSITLPDGRVIESNETPPWFDPPTSTISSLGP